MVYQTPAGARDLLPLEVAQKHWIEGRVEQVFQRWGYHRIITSTVEQLDTLMAGGAIAQDRVIEVRPGGSQRLGLRPELTASIARAAVTRMAQLSYPQRLYYTANVFRQTERSSQGGQQEFYQSGVELLGAADANADAEVLLLLAECLSSLNLQDWGLVLGDAQLTQALLRPFPPEVRPQVRQAIAQLDRVALEQLSLPNALHQRALTLFDLRGQPETVLQTTAQMDLDPEASQAVHRLKGVVDLLRQVINQGGAVSPTVPTLVLDLSLVQPFDYYTGLVFEVVSAPHQGCQILGQGGRYDHLLGVFHPEGRSFPGVGFVLHTDALHQALLAKGHLPATTEPSEWLVVPRTPAAAAAAFTHAQTIRHSTSLVRVEVYLADADPESVRHLARQRHIRRIAWIDTDGRPEVEALA